MPVADVGGIGEISDSCRGGREEVKSVDKITGMRQSDQGCLPTGSWAGPAEGSKEKEVWGSGLLCNFQEKGQGLKTFHIKQGSSKNPV